MGNKKKILFFMWSFSLGGGAEKILATIVNNIDLTKYDVDILELEHYDKPMENVPKGVRILKSWQNYKTSKLKHALLWRMRIYFPSWVRNQLIKDEYDIEVSFTIMNPPFPFSKRKDVKKIAWIHGSIENFKQQENYKKAHYQQLKCADKIIGISQKTYQSIIDVYPDFKDKVEIIYNGYDFDAIRQKAQESIDIEMPENSICVIGRIEKQKGSDKVVELMRQLHEKNKKYHLYFIGSGELETSLKQKVKEYNLSDYIHFLGYQKNPYKYLNKTKLLLSQSLQEGFPGVYVEALSLGIPFVSTEVGGSEELSQNGKYGKIVFNDEEAITAISTYMEFDDYDKNAAKKFVEQFTIVQQMKKINQLFES